MSDLLNDRMTHGSLMIIANSLKNVGLIASAMYIETLAEEILTYQGKTNYETSRTEDKE